jgi:hypothetical protein
MGAVKGEIIQKVYNKPTVLFCNFRATCRDVTIHPFELRKPTMTASKE